MADDLIKVRASNEGDEFHILWSARRLLRLLNTDGDPRGPLVAVKIEGVSSAEGTSVRSGELGIDTAEYYGSETIRDADKVVYYQHKHSTTRADQPLGAADLEEPLRYFAKRYFGFVTEFGVDVVASRLSFVLVTNRPISKNVLEAVAAAREGDPGRLKGEPRTAYDRLAKELAVDKKPAEKKKPAKSEAPTDDVRLSDADLCAFLRLVDMPGNEPGRASQAEVLGRELAAFIPARDPDVRLRLADLVRQEAMPEARNNPPIRREKLLAALNVADSDLRPAPADFPPCDQLVARAHDRGVGDAIIAAQWPVVVAAHGGTGKTVLAQSLGSLMPSESVTVVFDGFCNGDYRRLRQPRHGHRQALTQICNELAVQGVCDPLLPLRAEDHEYLQAFHIRLEQAAATVRARNPEALVVVVLDAADNSVMAAESVHDTAFVWGLLQEPPPEGCRIVAFARPYRVEMLKPHSNVARLSFDGFTQTESAANLRRHLRDVDDAVAEAFHRLTSGNPRVQSYFLARKPATGDELISMLGRAGRSVDDIISEEVERALAAVREIVEDAAVVDRLCFLLGQLPPLVPVPVLARAAGVPESAVQSFVADLPHPLLIRENAVQFRDEPVEHWFHQRFPGSPEDYSRAADRLEPLARGDAYTAMALPRLFYEAGRREGLLTLALSDEGPIGADPVSRRDIVRMRIGYALRAALRDGRRADAAKLFIRAAEEAATQSRQTQFIRANADLFAVVMPSQDVADLLFREHRDLWKGWGLAHSAAVFALSDTLKPEARSTVRQAAIWIDDWVKAKKAIDPKEFIAALAALTHAGLQTFDASSAFDYVCGWSPWVRVRLGYRLAERLIDHDQLELLSDICTIGEPDVFFHLGVLVALDEVSKGLAAGMALSLGAILRNANPLDEIDKHSPDDDADTVRHGVVVLAEWLAAAGEKDLAGVLLARYRPELRDHVPTPHGEGPDRRVTLLRATALDAALTNREVTVADLKPDSLKDKDVASTRRETIAEFDEFYGAVLPLFVVRARGIVGALPPRSAAEALSAESQKIGRNDYRYDHWRFSGVPNITPRFRLDAALRLGFADNNLVRSLDDWVGARQLTAKFPLLIQLARTAARHDATRDAAHLLADRADHLIASARLGAAETANSYASLARAVLAVHRDLARGYLGAAARILDRLDYEARERLETIYMLACRPGMETVNANPADAYRVARVAEAVEAVNDHKFPWDSVATAMARLSPASALAIVSRWRDRGRVRLDDTLPFVTQDLVERGLIAPGIAAALDALAIHWKGRENLEALLAKARSAPVRDAIFTARCWDVLVDGADGHGMSGLISVGRKHGLDTRALETRLALMGDEVDRTSTYDPPLRTDREEPPPPDWEALLGGKSWNTAEELDVIVEAAEEAEDQRIREPNFLNEMRGRTSRHLQAAYVRALAGSRRLSAERVVWELKCVAEQWNGADVRVAVKEAAEQVLERRALDLLRGEFGLIFRDNDLEPLTGWTRERVVRRFAEAAADHLDGISSRHLLVLGEEMSQAESHAETLGILRFALDRFDLVLEEEDGDGPWNASLAPEPDVEKAVAGLMWAALGAPEITTRWRAAHAVRRLCAFGETGVLGHLVGWMERTDAGPFVDQRLTFYYLHARLFLLVALARAAIDHPAMVAPHVPAIARHAIGSSCLPHAVIRLYARDACLAVEAALPGTNDAATAANLWQVGVSRHPPVARPPWPYSSDNWLSPGEAEGDCDYRFEYNLSRYGFSAIGSAFGLTAKDIGSRVGDWCKRLSADNGGLDWREDRRLQRGVLRGEEVRTLGGYAKADNLNFYLTIHAMMCAAGELHDTRPLVMQDGEPHDWNQWIEDHRLIRSDRRWIADRRDPPPPRPHQSRPRNETTEAWRDGIIDDDFAGALFGGERRGWVVVSGCWTERAGHGEESITVSSALVDSARADALVRALQSASDPDTFAFPEARFAGRRAIPNGFRMSGLTVARHAPTGLDRYDPLSGRINYPPTMPRPALIRLLDLHMEDDARVWRSTGLGDVFRSQLWGHWDERDSHSERYQGQRLMAALAGIDALLQRTGRDLVIWVRVQRICERYRHDYSETCDRRTIGRAYVLRAGGELLDGTGRRCHLGEGPG